MYDLMMSYGARRLNKPWCTGTRAYSSYPYPVWEEDIDDIYPSSYNPSGTIDLPSRRHPGRDFFSFSSQANNKADVEEAMRAHVEAKLEFDVMQEKFEECKRKFEDAEKKVQTTENRLRWAKAGGWR